MKNTLKLSFAIILILLINGCGKNEKKEQEPKETVVVQREFGKWKTKNDSLVVELNTKKFNNWNDLVERVGKIVCNDSIPKITLRTNNEIRTIYFHNPCWEDDSYKIIKSKNVFEIHNDTIFKHEKGTFPLVPKDTFIDNLAISSSSTTGYDTKEEEENVMKWNLKIKFRIKK